LRYLRRSVLRVSLVAAVVAAGAISSGGPAGAQTPGTTEPKPEFAVTVARNGGRHAKGPRATRIALELRNVSAGEGSHIRFFHPKQVRVSGKGLRKCPQSSLDSLDPGRCPGGSRVGTGTADVTPNADGTATSEVKRFNVTAFLASNARIALMIRSQARDAPIDRLARGVYRIYDDDGDGLVDDAFGFGTFLDVKLPALLPASSDGFTGRLSA
jgi:hypothetical protein